MKAKIDNLYFPVATWDFNQDKLVTRNIFDYLRVQDSVAHYLKIFKNPHPTTSDKHWQDTLSDEHSKLFYIFGDVWGRVEWEFMVNDKTGEIVGGVFSDTEYTFPVSKYSVFDYFIAPNGKKLLKMIDRCTYNDAKNHITRRNKELGRYRRKPRVKS